MIKLQPLKKLWSSEKAGRVMNELVNYCDVIMANEEDAEMVFGIMAYETYILNST